MDRSLGERKLELMISRRKSHPHRHSLTRDCMCIYGGKRGEVKLGPKLCAVHRLWKFLRDDKVNDLAKSTGFLSSA